MLHQSNTHEGGYTDTSKSLSAYFTSAEIIFLEGISERIAQRAPERGEPLVSRYARYAEMKARSRVRQGFIELRNEPRWGLLQRGLKPEFSQSVYGHSQIMHEMILALRETIIFRLLEELGNKEELSGTVRKALIKSKIHDLPEVLMTDFTPQDMIDGLITKEEKTELERMAAKLLYEAFPNLQDFQEEYEGKRGFDDKLVKIVDLLEWGVFAASTYSSPEKFDPAPEESLDSILKDAREKFESSFPEFYRLFGEDFFTSLEDLYTDPNDPLLDSTVPHECVTDRFCEPPQIGLVA